MTVGGAVAELVDTTAKPVDATHLVGVRARVRVRVRVRVRARVGVRARVRGRGRVRACHSPCHW